MARRPKVIGVTSLGGDPPSGLREPLAGIQSDFGGYDHRFAGVTIQLPKYDHWPLLLASGQADAARVVKVAESKSAANLFEVLSLLTVWPHEVRHFHDALIAPFGSAVFWRRFLITAYGMQFIFKVRLDLGDAPGSWILPVPITKWFDARVDERDAWHARWTSHCGRPVEIIPLPQPGSDETSDLARLLSIVRRHSSALKEFFIDDWGNAAAKSVYITEASALLAQWAAISVRFGDRRTQVFLDGLQAHARSPYAFALKYLEVLGVIGGSRIELPPAQAAVTWSLLGDVLNGGREQMPLLRFARLVQHLTDHGLPDTTDIANVGEVFEEWDRSVGRGSSIEAVAAALEQDVVMAGNVHRQLTTAPEPARTLLRQIVPAMDMWLAARRAMVNTFIKDPGLYCDPIGYVTEGGGRYIDPPCMFVAQKETLSSTAFARAGLEGAGYKILETLGEEDPIVMAFGGPQNADSTISLASAFEASRYNLMCDYVFGEFRRELGQYEHQLLLSAMGTAKIRTAEILG